MNNTQKQKKEKKIGVRWEEIWRGEESIIVMEREMN